MAGRVVTIEINSTSIRLMETEEGRVVKWASRSLESGMFDEEVISNPQALSAAVRQVVASSGIDGRNVIASVSGLYSLSRIVMVPGVPGVSVTQQAVLEKVREIIPLPEDELYLSWQAIATVGGEQQTLVVGVPRDIIDNEVRALQMAGVNPRVLDLKTMALARAANREQALILNIEPTSFDIVIVANGVAEVMRTTAWREGELSLEEKAEYLAVALELTVGFYDAHHSGFPLDPATPLFITGTKSGDLTLIERLQARIRYSVAPLAPPLEYPEHLPVSQYAVNIGLALKGTAVAKSPGQGEYLPPDINLLPRIYRPWRPSARQIYFFCAIVALLALLFPLFQLNSNAGEKTATLQARFSIIKKEMERRQLELVKREPLQRAITEYQTIVNMGGGFVEDLEVINRKAEELGVKVQGITCDTSAITFLCEADSYTTFRSYLTALEKSGRFSSIARPPEQYSYVKTGTITLQRQSSH